jgi:ABC-2 type transport system permease protein
MEKMWAIFRITLLQYLNYRLSFVLWRVRNIMNLVLVYFLWTSVSFKSTIFSYNKAEIITYVLLINILTAIIFSSRTADIAGEILNGSIINYLLKPLSFFKYITAREIADKGINLGFAFLEIILMLLVLRPEVVGPKNIESIFAMIIFVSIAVGLSFFLSLMLSFIAFWSEEVWAPRFIFFVVVTALSGSFFPLDILPKNIYTVLSFTPFPYLIYFPAKVYLSGFTFELFVPLLVGLAWLFIMYQLTFFVWKRGVKNFSFYGR